MQDWSLPAAGVGFGIHRNDCFVHPQMRSHFRPGVPYPFPDMPSFMRSVSDLVQRLPIPPRTLLITSVSLVVRRVQRLSWQNHAGDQHGEILQH